MSNATILRRDHSLCHHQGLLKLEIDIIGLGRIIRREDLRRLARDGLDDRRRIGARRTSASGVPTSLFSTSLRSARLFGRRSATSSCSVGFSTTKNMPPRPF